MIKILKEDEDLELRKRMLEMTKNKTYRQIQEKCRECGYVLLEAFWSVFRNGEKYLQFRLKPDNKSRYTPDIRFDVDSWNDSSKGEFNFKIQTSSYGSLDEEQYKEYIDSVNKAYELVDFLTNRVNLYDLDEFTGI